MSAATGHESGRAARGLVLIDIQAGFADPRWGARNNPEAEANAGRLLAHWRAAGAPVFHVRHISADPTSPLHPSGGGTGFHEAVTPLADEPVIDKSVNSAFIGTTLERDLREARIERLVVCGLTTPHCVSTTVRMAANLGFAVELAHDACAAFSANADTSWRDGGAVQPRFIHQAALDHLHGEFAQVRAVDELSATAP